MRRVFSAPAYLLVILGGCSGAIGPDPSGPGGGGGENGTNVPGPRAGNGGTAQGGSSGAVGGSSGTLPPPAAACARPGVVPGPAPLVRLTNTEYRNTIRDLFPKVSLSALPLGLPAEVATQGFLNNAGAQTPSADVIDDVAENAEAVAAAVTADLTKLLPCKPAGAADEPACGKQFLQAFGKQAFRRPLSPDEQTRYERFFTDAHGRWGFAAALRLLVTAVLQSPSFLYRIEVGGTASAGTKAVPLDGYQVASRLSYLLLDSMPDAALMMAADGGKLATAAGVEAEARRLLALPRAREAVSSFLSQWLRFSALENLSKSADLYPTFSPKMATALKDAAVKYVDRVFWDEGKTLQALLTDDHAFVDETLAPLYGVPRPAGTGLVWTRVDGAQRAGILTHVGLMAGLAHERTSAPVLRGIFVLDRLLCATPPAPPVDVNTTLPPLPAGAKLTTRQQLEQSHSTPTCAACHRSIDGLGFGFENYDALGVWRTKEQGLDVDARGEVVGTDVDGTFNGAVALSRKLAESQQVRQCVASQALAYALAVSRDDLDACAVDGVVRPFAAAGGDLRELLVAIVKSDAFRHRPVAP